MTDHHDTEPTPSDDDLLPRLGFHAMPEIRRAPSSHDDLLARLAHQALHGVRPHVANWTPLSLILGHNRSALALKPYASSLHGTADGPDGGDGTASRVTPAAPRPRLPQADEVTLLRERIRDAVVSLETIHDQLIFDNPDAADAIAAVTFRLSPSGDEDEPDPEQSEAPGAQVSQSALPDTDEN